MSDIWPIIRIATLMDQQPAFELMSELGYPGLSFVRFSAAYNAVLEHPTMSLIVAEDENGDVIGLASISTRPQLRLTANLVTIDELVIADRARGRGVGKKILKTVEVMARNLRAGRLELETNRARESYSRGFYIKNGFKEADSAVMRIDYQLPADSHWL
ncbi:MAG TPA: GNAT family N-acetyltransferase [Blastocatellia bacterium]|nr:GNAT family N-acetyltransferase [Blastocatellia bacterium]